MSCKNKSATIMAWVLKTLQHVSKTHGELCRECADIFPEIGYDTIRAGVYRATKIPGIQRDGKKYRFSG